MVAHYHSDGTTVEFSQEATVSWNGTHYSAFQRNSYLARVTFPGRDDAVVVVLPCGARSVGHEKFRDRVLSAAVGARYHNLPVGFVN